MTESQSLYDEEIESYHKQLAAADAVLSFHGGLGGTVAYQGTGQPLVKRNAPVDRITYMSLKGELRYEIGLTVVSGLMDHTTGAAGPTTAGPGHASFYMQGNDDPEALIVRGAIWSLNLNPHTELYRSKLGPSYTEVLDKGADGFVRVPHWGTNHEIVVNPRVLEFFGVEQMTDSIGIHLWDKTGKNGTNPRKAFLVSQAVARLDVLVTRR